MRHLFLSAILLMVSIAPMASAQGSHQSALDVVFVVENCTSMRKVDLNRVAPEALNVFAGNLPPGSRFGVVLFGSGTELVKDLKSTSSPGLVASLADALHLIRYRGRLSNLPAGVERAIYELHQNGRGDAKKIILIISDGRIATGRPTTTAENTRWLLSGLMEEAKRNGVQIFIAVLGKDADFRIPETLTLATGGSYFRALNAESLPAVLPKIIDSLTEAAATKGIQREQTPATPVPSRNPYWAWLLWIMAIFLVTVAVAILFLSRRFRRPSADTTTEHGQPLNLGPPSMPQLRDQGGSALRTIAEASQLLHSLEEQLKTFQAFATEYVIAADKAAESTEERYSSLINDCISTVDFLDIMSREKPLSGDTSLALGRALKRVTRILEHAQVTEIPVQCGLPFDNATQEYSSSADRGEPYGAVTKIERKGYMMTSPSGGSVVLRPARVEVSRRPVTQERDQSSI
ncbi:MAG TPA: nucleotide exchange factor GrpE [Candidatus Acidoferrales bacterium]|nr:nucleotide exchange factor GrpE [Candidatus Acidoferrales bacterium]